MFKCKVIYGLYFLVFGLNMDIYWVNFRIQSEYRKIRTRNNSVFGHFWLSDMFKLMHIFNKKFSFSCSEIIGRFTMLIISNFCNSWLHISWNSSNGMQQTKSKWIVTVCRADLAIPAVNFLSYRNKNLIQATFLFCPNRPCLRNFFMELKKKKFKNF